jgi:N-acylglucosamine 2-epimerase
LGLDLIRWGFDLGWDPQYGGIFNDVDAEGKPMYGANALLADTKLWWQAAEALYGLLLGFAETGDPWYWEAYRKVHEYSFSHFADPEFGEWYGYLDRTGRPINTSKGSDRKTVFHIGRNFFWCARLAKRFK